MTLSSGQLSRERGSQLRASLAGTVVPLIVAGGLVSALTQTVAQEPQSPPQEASPDDVHSEQRPPLPYLAPATYRELDLFSPIRGNPIEINLAAGGEQAASDLGLPSGCVGRIHAVAPDLVLRFVPGEAALRLSVHSYADTSLIVRTPDGNWICSDDVSHRNPEILLPTPVPGRYSVWVGASGRAVYDAKVRIEEVF